MSRFEFLSQFEFSTFVTRVWLHRETMDLKKNENHVIEEIFKLLSDIEESTIKFSDFYLFRVQR